MPAVIVGNVVKRNKTWREAADQLIGFWINERDDGLQGLASTVDYSKWWWNDALKNKQLGKSLRSKAALIRTLEGHSDSVNSVDITSDNSKIVSGSLDNSIKIWDLHQGKYCLSVKFDASISTIAFSITGSFLWKMRLPLSALFV